jgi:hypothetical protein
MIGIITILGFSAGMLFCSLLNQGWNLAHFLFFFSSMAQCLQQFAEM